MADQEKTSNYEIALIISASLTDEEVKKVISSLEEEVKKNKGEIVSRDDWGRKKLNYVIRKENMGYYFFLKVSLLKSQIEKVATKIRLNRNVLRCLIETL